MQQFTSEKQNETKQNKTKQKTEKKHKLQKYNVIFEVHLQTMKNKVFAINFWRKKRTFAKPSWNKCWQSVL